MFSFQVTIRASLTGKAPTLPSSPDRSGFVVSQETLSFSPQTKPPVGVSTSKSNVPAAGKAKATQSKKQGGRATKHNLVLKNLRLLTELFHPALVDTLRFQTDHLCSKTFFISFFCFLFFFLLLHW